MNKILKVILILFASTGLLFVGGLVFLGWSMSGVPEEFKAVEFDSMSWSSSKPEMSWDSIRLKMVDDLIANHLRKGMSEKEIVSLIGRPDDTSYFKEFDMVYYLGRERSMIGIDSEWLVIKFKNGKIDHLSIVSD